MRHFRIKLCERFRQTSVNTWRILNILRSINKWSNSFGISLGTALRIRPCPWADVCKLHPSQTITTDPFHFWILLMMCGGAATQPFDVTSPPPVQLSIRPAGSFAPCLWSMDRHMSCNFVSSCSQYVIIWIKKTHPSSPNHISSKMTDSLSKTLPALLIHYILEILGLEKSRVNSFILAFFAKRWKDC